MNDVWAKRYESLPKEERDEVNAEVDRRFRERTRVTRALDPSKDLALRLRWLQIRDEVMAQIGGKGAPDPRKTSRGFFLALPKSGTMMQFLIYNFDIGSDQPKEQHLKALDKAMGVLLKSGLELMVGVEGHASRTGGEGYDNSGLSERRAKAIDSYLRKIGKSSIKVFFKAGGAGAKQQVSKNPFYREAWPKLDSLDEDERDRSVIVSIQVQQPGIIDGFSQPVVDWKKAFDQAAPRAALIYLSQMGISIVGDYVPSPIPSPWNPITGWPTSWTTGNPDADEVMKAMGKTMIDDIELAAKRKGLKISRDEIIRHYQDWLKDPNNKWTH
ncbi:OmpA family protein [Bradyrhizobium sp.]|uniref:OmpA family protein n=1 Tax=Bradyrhizobium sp. TaxID=376 RepID=UPI001ED0DBD2|nr:OmpA family protein [Bradyrhizobium sp.]MBV9985492.1 OmpA family protein [Bradyrhizobium sp.]